MPELPEVETIRRRLRLLLAGATVEGAEVLRPTSLRDCRSRDMSRLAGRRIVGVERKGKLAILDLGGRCLVFHLKMTGSLEVRPERRAGRSTSLVVRGTDREGKPFFLHFNDTRRFGFVALVAGDPFASGPAAALGPDALDVTPGGMAEILASSRRRLKPLLLDQKKIAGIGNIYADEILHRCGLHPLTPANRIPAARAADLHKQLRAVLDEAIAGGGSSVRDYLDPCGRRGSFQDRHAVYGRTGEPCLTCGRTIVRTVVGGRGTHFCPGCQPLRFRSPAVPRGRGPDGGDGIKPGRRRGDRRSSPP